MKAKLINSTKQAFKPIKVEVSIESSEELSAILEFREDVCSSDIDMSSSSARHIAELVDSIADEVVNK